MMSRTSFRVNPHSIICLNVKELLVRSRRHIRPVWVNSLVFIYELSGCGFESRCFHYSNPCWTWNDLVFIYKFDNAVTFKHQGILLFWYHKNLLKKDKTGWPPQINIDWSVFIGLVNRRGLNHSHIWTIQLLSLNAKVSIRFIIYFFRFISFLFFVLFCFLTVMLDKRFVH